MTSELTIDLEKTDKLKDSQTRTSRCLYLPAVQLNPMNTTSRSLTGNGFKAYVNISIRVENPDAGVSMYQTRSNSGGQFSYYFNQTLPAGSKITVYQYNSWGSSVNTSIWVTSYTDPEKPIDPVKILAPTVGEVTEDSTTISGITSPNVFVQLKIAGDIYRTVADVSGKFMLTLDGFYSAGSVIEVYAYDAQNNKSETTLASVLPGRMSLGIDYITSQDRVISGNTAANMSVEVMIGNRVYSGYSDQSGKFTISLSVTYKSGTSVLVVVTNKATAQSVQMSTVIYPALPSVSYVMPGSNKITGIADPGAFVTVSVADGNKISALANAAGYYELVVNPIYTTVGKKIIVSQVINNMTSQEVEYTIY
ncbi:hypothetical protein CMALT430_550001 [Carnobacterium maltaromaticum]|nr:hypothetical protein CMALT430_550001 [Carnobacterium maltaromaticum]